MKIRTGFVSNSSSSSFCIYGINIGRDDLVNLLFKEELLVKPDHEFDSEDIYQKVEEAGLEYHRPPDSDYYIGKSWSTVDDDQTGNQFKAEVIVKLEKLLGTKDLNPSTHEQGWFDG